MDNDISDYERLCDEELAAADLAERQDVRIEHLEQAFRFAKKASTERAARVVSAHLSA
jgi:LPS O-antigen subunit length determinant protein (WzzB/FepE family)